MYRGHLPPQCTEGSYVELAACSRTLDFDAKYSRPYDPVWIPPRSNILVVLCPAPHDRLPDAAPREHGIDSSLAVLLTPWTCMAFPLRER